MRNVRIVIAVVWMGLLVAHCASAQILPGIAEITGYGGITINGIEENTLGVALTVNTTPHLGVEGELGVIFAKEKIININADLVFNFGSGASLFVPYVAGGAGVLNNGGTDIALNAGAGMKVFVEPNIALRIDFRGFFTSEDGDMRDMERFYGGIDFFF